MAIIDYGAIVIKNGKLINSTEVFQNMEKAVGWTDINNPDHRLIDGNYFAYIGDEELTICFFKNIFRMIKNKDVETRYYIDMEPNKFVTRINVDGTDIKVKDILGNGSVFMLSTRYKGDFYNVIYGYGIDSSPKIWNMCKIMYLGKKNARKIDNILRAKLY